MVAYQPVNSRSGLAASASSFSSGSHSQDDTSSSRAPLYRPVPRSSGLKPHSPSSRPSHLSTDSDATGSFSSRTGKKFVLTPGISGYTMDAETDDWLHDSADADKRSHGISFNGCLNIMTLIFLALALIGLFAGYPIVAHFDALAHKKATGSINLGGTNGSGQIPDLNIRQLIDPQTPRDAMTWQGQTLDARLRSTNYNYHLVFSDEFNEEGRTFWKGDDPFWEAVDIWYGATMDYEWYSPEAMNTTGGNLVITMEAMEINNLNFRSGMLQSWNKFCFQGGYIEFNAIMPGRPDTMGYWPGLWTMGNLARPGFLGSTEGLWPYSYEDKCDSGVLANQLFANRSGPDATVEGIGRYSAVDPHENGGRGGPRRLSSLPGMRFPACTCSGEDHPGPNRHTSRTAPEIDALEAQIQYRNGRFDAYASQSLQMAPFDAEYDWTKGGSGRAFHIYDEDTTRINDYTGGPYQQCASGLARCPRDGYTDAGNRMVRYGFEYQPDFGQNGNSYVTWYVDGQPTWTVYGGALDPRRAQDMSRRLVSTEPMSIILNLAMAAGFQPVRFTGANALNFPAQFLVDYVRVYQRDGQDDKITCDPADHPTAEYIKTHPELYLNRELISYQSSKYSWPKNELTGC